MISSLPDSDLYRRIAIFRPGALGDNILALPALAALRQRFPRAHLTYFGNPAVRSLFAGQLAVDVALSIDDPSLAPFFLPPDELLFNSALGQAIPEARDAVVRGIYGELVDLDLAVLWLSDASAFAANLRRFGAKGIIVGRSRPAPEVERHVADHLMDTLFEVLPAEDDRLAMPRICLKPEDRALGERFWQANGWAGRSVLALHPGSGSPLKCWAAERFAGLADHFAAQGIAVLIVAGPADAAVLDAFQAALTCAQPVVASDRSVLELAAILSQSSAFVGNDSGVSHLAAALGVPSIALYGPTNPRVWGIRGTTVVSIARPSLDRVLVADVVRAVAPYLRPSPHR